MSGTNPTMNGQRMTGTDGFKVLAMDAQERNRAPHKELLDSLDPDGIHITWPARSMIHREECGGWTTDPRRNKHERVKHDLEIRFTWLVKIVGEEKPVLVVMDNSFAAIKAVAPLCSEVDRHDEEEQA